MAAVLPRPAGWAAGAPGREGRLPFRMRVLIFHGYLLGGTGSNVYNARLARALVGLGHEVHLLCQERHPEEHRFIDAAGEWDSGTLKVRELAGPREPVPGSVAGRCTIYRPDIGGLLPVYVADRYEGIEARTFAECTDEQVARYIEANVQAVGEVCALIGPHVALANHLVMGPVILARALAGAVPYAVKVHGSALEYTVKPEPGRFLELAREGLADARGVLVGSRHTAVSLWEALGQEDLPGRTRLGPPGVDVERFVPREPAEARTAVAALAARLGRSARIDDRAPDAFARDERTAAESLARLDVGEDRLVAFVGKLIVSKGIDLLLAAWPLVLGRVTRARLLVIGFGAYREGLEALVAALSEGDLEGARQIARAGRTLEGQLDAAQPLRHLLAFFDGLRERSASAISRWPEVSASGFCSRDGSITRSWWNCCPRARRSSYRARSPRRSEWSPPRPRRAVCCRSARPTRGSRR